MPDPLRVVLIKGHCSGPKEHREASEPCTLEDFFETNQFDATERVAIRDGLADEGFYRYGGGATAEVTIMELDAWREMICSLDIIEADDARLAAARP